MITCYPAYAYATFDTFSFKTKFSKYFQIEIGGRGFKIFTTYLDEKIKAIQKKSLLLCLSF